MKKLDYTISNPIDAKNPDLVIRERTLQKINEVVEWIDDTNRFLNETDFVIKFKDSLVCNTLPEEKKEGIKIDSADYTEEQLFRENIKTIDRILSRQSSEPKHNHSRGQAGCGECQKKEKELFDMVYMWGRLRVETDEKCNAFQDLLKEIKL